MDGPQPPKEAGTPETLVDRKLRLEIAELERSVWSKPSVVIPLVATLLTLGFSQYLGVFDVQRTRIENQRHDLQRDQLAFDAERKKLDQQQQQLATEIAASTKRRETLTAQLAELDRQSQLVKELSSPALSLRYEVIPQDRLANITLENHGRSAGRVKVVKQFADGKPFLTGTRTDPYGPALDAIGDFNYRWLQWKTVEGDILESGQKIALLNVFQREFTEQRAAAFKTLITRFGLEICYCSLVNTNCRWVVFNRPESQSAECPASPAALTP